MAIFTLGEVFDIILMCAASAFIFMNVFKKPSTGDPVEDLRQGRGGFRDKFLYSLLLVSVPIVLHEFGHKFVAMYFGYAAVFHAAYVWLAIGIVLRLLNSSFIFLVPAFVSYNAAASAGESLLISFAGPAVHLIIWAVASLVLLRKQQKESHAVFWKYTQYINGFLFIFNMIPIPGFDGSHVFGSLISMF